MFGLGRRSRRRSGCSRRCLRPPRSDRYGDWYRGGRFISRLPTVALRRSLPVPKRVGPCDRIATRVCRVINVAKARVSGPLRANVTRPSSPILERIVLKATRLLPCVNALEIPGTTDSALSHRALVLGVAGRAAGRKLRTRESTPLGQKTPVDWSKPPH